MFGCNVRTLTGSVQRAARSTYRAALGWGRLITLWILCVRPTAAPAPACVVHNHMCACTLVKVVHVHVHVHVC